MKFLFFDQEFASSFGGTSKICEFGYVITNESFEVLNRYNIIINPNLKRYQWDKRVVREILKRNIEEYENGITFPKAYETIKHIISSADYVFGHSLDGDAKALNDECKRYYLPSINFVFYDIKKFYKDYINTSKNFSVTNILKELKIDGENGAHDAETDAYNTMLELKTMLERLEINVEDLIELCPEVKDINENYQVLSTSLNLERKQEIFNLAITGNNDNTLRYDNYNMQLYSLFLENVKPQKVADKKLSGQKVCISPNYIQNHYKQILNIIQLLCNHGASFTKKKSEANISVFYDSNNSETNQNTLEKETISLDDLLNRLGTSQQELDEMPIVSFDCLYDRDVIFKDLSIKKLLINRNELEDKKKEKELQAKESKGTTLGDLYPELFESFEKD